ncbi:Retrotransposon-like protein 1 [Amphibalanus amphitrite]|uniref:Retrotransposon-like protein 1 n=1 Tax=Amphibalanus amphitrite TaxID=1232801 RepID=A0A6A4VMY7_AMPAM|nr:Retrotransposon-like protein 1 [Amphibalanus amphitrite]
MYSSISEHYNRRMDEAFQGLAGYKRIADDVVIYSRTKEEHASHVRKFMARCEERGISLNLKKLQLARSEVKFAGFVISRDGYRPDPQLTTAISSFPTPKTVSDLR